VKPTFRIDGAAFSDLAGFYDEIERALLGGAPWGRSLDALDDVLRGGVAGVPREFRLVWEHADLSRRRLSREGPGSFGALLERIAAHRNVELILS
jgi:RNAse (barnase) inhibitor barstar